MNIKKLILTSAFLFNVAYAEENMSLADSPKENVKYEFQISSKYEDSGKYANAIAHLIKAKKYNLFTEIIDAKINSIKNKINYNETENCKLGVANFNNSTPDPTLPSLLINKINEEVLSGNNSSLVSKTLEQQVVSEFTTPSQIPKNVDLIITGDVSDFRIEEHVKVNSKSTQYVSGKNRIPNQKYNELALETSQIYAAWQNAKLKSEERKSDGLIWGGGKALLGAAIGSDSLVREGAAGVVASYTTDAILSDKDKLESLYNQKKRELESTPQYHTENLYGEYSYNIENHIKEGTLKISIKIIEPKSSEIVFNKTLDKYVKAEDKYVREYSPANISGDPLNIKSNQEIREELITNTVLEIKDELKQKLKNFKKRKLKEQAKQEKLETALENYLKIIKVYDGTEEDWVDLTNNFNKISGTNLSTEALKAFFK